MRILSSISLLILGIGLVASILTYSPHDIRPGEWFLPSPRPVDNIMGPFGAWLSLHLINLCGYSAIAIGFLVIIWSLGRIFKWRPILLAKITGLTLGWIIALALPIAAVGGEAREILIGQFGEALVYLLNYTGAVGKFLVSFAILIAWIFWSTGIGFKRPARWIASAFGATSSTIQSISKRRREKLQQQKKKLIEQHRVQQEKLHRRKPSGRTTVQIPSDLPEELLVPPGAKSSVEQPSGENSESSGNIETPPGLQDMEFVPPPIIKSNTVVDEDIDKAEYDLEVDSSEQAVAPPFKPSKPSEEFIVPIAETEAEKLQGIEKSTENFPAEDADTDERELPKWLMREIPEQMPGLVDDAMEKPATEIEKEVPDDIAHETEETEETIQVIEPEESPGVEIDALEEDENEKSIEFDGDETATEKPKDEQDSDEEDLMFLQDAPYEYPSEEILSSPSLKSRHFSDVELQIMARKLFDALRTYRIEGSIKAITPGPVITRYEFEPVPGTKVSRIAQLADDLALALKARNVRIVAPIPGKGTVGIEVPNKKIDTVFIRSVLESPAFKNTKAGLPMALGKGVAGEPVIADLAKMPHLLIAGATGSGKSVCINSILTSLLYKKSPRELRLLLIDPKRLELSIYNDIPFLIAPVVVENKEASASLNWALTIMESRYEQLAKARVRKLQDFNKMVESKPELGQPLPYIVIVVDELADLMMTVAGEIEEPIARLAQMARAVGIHLILATQRPSVDVVTGIIKANFPSRIAFKVRSRIDSRTILDMGGAERLLGQGDMLYLPSGFADPVRIHGSYISTEETEMLVEYLKQYPNPQNAELSFKEEIKRKMVANERDDLFWEAAKIIVMAQKGSASHLQRKLRIGYTRAASLIDQLEASGIVGAFEGSKPRELLVKTLEEIDEMMKTE